LGRGLLGYEVKLWIGEKGGGNYLLEYKSPEVGYACVVYEVYSDGNLWIKTELTSFKYTKSS
jgi:hypothetical protein